MLCGVASYKRFRFTSSPRGRFVRTCHFCCKCVARAQYSAHLAMRYRVHSTKVKPGHWYPTKAEAIAAFERQCKRLGISPPTQYPPRLSGDSITKNGIAYPRSTCAAGMRDGHGWVYVDAPRGCGGRVMGWNSYLSFSFSALRSPSVNDNLPASRKGCHRSCCTRLLRCPTTSSHQRRSLSQFQTSPAQSASCDSRLCRPSRMD